MTDWRPRIVDLVLIKQRIDELDAQGIWQYTLPRVAATEDTLRFAEAALGEPLDRQYREFLGFAAGWPCFYQYVDLFGPEELIGPRQQAAMAKVATMVEPDDAQRGLVLEDLLVIADNPTDRDVFVMMRPRSPLAGSVVWLAGGEIDRFPSFEEYFLAMMDYNRREVDDLLGERAHREN